MTGDLYSQGDCTLKPSKAMTSPYHIPISCINYKYMFLEYRSMYHTRQPITKFLVKSVVFVFLIDILSRGTLQINLYNSIFDVDLE